MALLRKLGVILGRSVQTGAGLLQPVDSLLVDGGVGHDLRRAAVQLGLRHAEERARDAPVAVGAAHVGRNPVRVGDRGGLEFVVFVIVLALTGAQIRGDGVCVGELLRLHLRLHVRVGLCAIDVVVVGRLGIDG